ncbi:MAG: hypothetical protein M3O82_07860 [Verrucomicrobiota bacterium]|nr:hypothetical protein [Verrucomicrobiota bacterium]
MTSLKLLTIAIALALPLSMQAAEKKAATAKAAPSPTAAAEKAEKKDAKSRFQGKIASTDATAKTVTLEGKTSRVLYVTSETKLKKTDGAAATWDDLKMGEQVRGSYVKGDDGKMTASTLKVGPKAEKKAKAAASPKS